MSRSWQAINNFAEIKGCQMSMSLDTSLWLDQTISKNLFEGFSTRFIVESLSPDMICVDVGANIGYYTLLMAFLAKNVLAFEPTAKYFQVLRDNCAMNLPPEKYSLFNIGLSDKTEEKEISVFGQSASIADIEAYRTQCEVKETIVLKRLDEVIDHRVDLIKIDCDGYDPFVIMGATETLRRFHPIIVMEVSPEYYDAAGVKVEDLYDLLDDIGYDMLYEVDRKKLSKQGLVDKSSSLSAGSNSFNLFCRNKI